MNYHDDSSGSSSDFFSPISMAFFRRPVARSETTARRTNTTLPPSHDNSWIGARLSPIFSFDKEGASDEEDNRSEERHRAIHDTLEAAPFVDERTSLLMKNAAIASTNPTPHPHGPTLNVNTSFGGTRTNHSKLHPLWRSPSSLGDVSKRQTRCCTVGFGSVVVTLSGIHLCAMGVYDIYQWYRRDGNLEDGSMSEVHAWSLPLLVPPYETLAMFGALTPDSILGGSWYNPSYSRFLSSLFIATSLAEWILIAGAWRLLHLSSARERRLPLSAAHSSQEQGIIYVASALVGQLWMWSYDSTHQLAVGCVAWGTCGVLCAAGMAHPRHRFELFSVATFLVILSLFERPYASVFGCTGSAFLGWALGACGFVERKTVDSVNYPGNGNDLKSAPAVTLLGTASAVLLLSLPVLNLAFRRDY